MPRGLEVFGSNGVLKFSTAGRLARFLLVVNIGTAAGSVSVPGLATGTPIIIISANTGSGTFVPPLPPTATFNQSNETVSWGASSWASGWVMTIAVY